MTVGTLVLEFALVPCELVVCACPELWRLALALLLVEFWSTTGVCCEISGPRDEWARVDVGAGAGAGAGAVVGVDDDDDDVVVVVVGVGVAVVGDADRVADKGP